MLRGISLVLLPIVIYMNYNTNKILIEQNRMLKEELTARDKGYHITDEIRVVAVEDISIVVNNKKP